MPERCVYLWPGQSTKAKEKKITPLYCTLQSWWLWEWFHSLICWVFHHAESLRVYRIFIRMTCLLIYIVWSHYWVHFWHWSKWMLEIEGNEITFTILPGNNKVGPFLNANYEIGMSFKHYVNVHGTNLIKSIRLSRCMFLWLRGISWGPIRAVGKFNVFLIALD